ncbi:MAG: helix-turn-helix domain-containing protein [Pseudomonadota bacterium]
MNDRKRLRIPSAMLQLVGELVQTQGVLALSDVLQRIGVTETEYHDPEFHFDGDQLLRLLRMGNWRGERGHPVAEVLDGFSWSSTGLLALAGMSSETVRDSLDVATNFSHLALPVIHLSALDRPGETAMQVELACDLEEMGPMMIELAIFGLKRMVDEITEELPTVQVKLAHPHWFGTDEAEAAARYLDYFNCQVSFNSGFSGIVGGPEFWEVPLRNANNATRKMALDMLEVADSKAGQADTFAGRVRAVLEHAAEEGLYLKLDELADKLHVTPRTLNRRLARDGLKFSDLVSELRLEKACELLRTTDWSVKRIAHRTGYVDSTSFTRAFKQLTGKTPRQWREHQSN